jgi:Ca2+-binding RTX toxin-like protein
MPGLRFIATYHGSADAPLGPLGDLDLYWSQGGPVLYATSRIEARITAFDIGDGGAALMGTRALPGSAAPLGGLQLDVVTLGDTSYVIAGTAIPAGLPRFALDADGRLGDGGDTLQGPGLGPDVTTLAPVEMQGRSWLLAVETGTPGLTPYEVTEAGRLIAPPPPKPGGPSGTDRPLISDLDTVRIGDSTFVFATDYENNRVYSYRMDAAGRLIETAALGATEGLGIAAPSQVAQVAMGGLTFLIVASAGSSSLTVLQVSPNGALTATDHLVDDRLTRFQGVTEIDVVQAEGRVYVIAGGADDGLSLFALRPDGRLIHLDSLADQPGQSLQNVSGLVAAARDGGIDIYATSETEAGISQFHMALEEGGVQRKAQAAGGRLDGTEKADTLHGGRGNDQLYGGAGGDLLLDGFGQDQLYGGAGADIFAFAADGKEDVIRDFDPAVDRIDISAWPMLRTLDQVKIVSEAYGGAVRYAGDGIKIVSASGGPLDTEAIAASILQNFHHYPVDFLTVDLDLIGTAADETLRGSAGNDMLNGQAGADLLIGGAGRDTAAYTGAKGPMIVDLVRPHLNTNDARGDRFEGIENLRGSAGSDDLRGDSGDNILEGGTNSDRLNGRAGDDELRGGMGFDTLIGGHGADLLKGGLLLDTADYSDSAIGLTADLGQRQTNTGIARGDRYQDVENLRGSAFGDTLGGDAGSNRLMGQEGDDTLLGRGGQDLLIGSQGNDRLDGGSGADVLRGGDGADSFVFRPGSGHDIVTDFFRGHDDRILLDDGFWSGSLSAKQVVARFGAVTLDGLVLEFGADLLLIEGQTTWNGIVERMEIV